MTKGWDGPICHISKESPHNKLSNNVSHVVTKATDTEKLLSECVKVILKKYQISKSFKYSELA